MDNEYRKASKLDPDRFATSFHPADHGILQALERVLVPQLDISRQVKIELCKLNLRRHLIPTWYMSLTYCLGLFGSFRPVSQTR